MAIKLFIPEQRAHPLFPLAPFLRDSQSAFLLQSLAMFLSPSHLAKPQPDANIHPLRPVPTFLHQFHNYQLTTGPLSLLCTYVDSDSTQVIVFVEFWLKVKSHPPLPFLLSFFTSTGHCSLVNQTL